MSQSTLPRRRLPGVKEVADYLGLPETTVRLQAHRKMGVGIYAFRVGRFLRWEWDDIDKFIADQKKARGAASA